MWICNHPFWNIPSPQNQGHEWWYVLLYCPFFPWSIFSLLLLMLITNTILQVYRSLYLSVSQSMRTLMALIRKGFLWGARKPCGHHSYLISTASIIDHSCPFLGIHCNHTISYLYLTFWFWTERGIFWVPKWSSPQIPWGRSWKVYAKSTSSTHCNLLASDSLSESRTAFWHYFGYRV